jgi:hypothetical protein
VANEATFRARLVACRNCVEDVDFGARELPFVGERAEQIAREPRGRVDDDGVEASLFGIACLPNEFAPGSPIVAATGKSQLSTS